MSFASLKSVLEPAMEGGYAVPAFNFWTYDDARAILEAADELKAPVILMASGSCVKNMGEAMVKKIVATLARQHNIPVVLHLDHAETVEQCLRAAGAGFSSVMYDGSKLPFEENVANTQFVVRAARAMGVSVEAEIGCVGRGEEGEDGVQVLSDPQSTLRFNALTGVDALAIAVGTQHGMQAQKADIRMDIVRDISQAVKVPLVLHGSSGVKNEDFPELIATGICKINVGTKLRNTFMESCQRQLNDDPKLKNHLEMFKKAREAVKEVVRDKITRMQAAGKA